MASMPPQGAPAPEGDAGNGMGDAVAQVGTALDALAEQAPEFGEVAQLFRSIVEGQVGGAQPETAGAMTPEQGASKARPMSMGG